MRRVMQRVIILIVFIVSLFVVSINAGNTTSRMETSRENEDISVIKNIKENVGKALQNDVVLQETINLKQESENNTILIGCNGNLSFDTIKEWYPNMYQYIINDEGKVLNSLCARNYARLYMIIDKECKVKIILESEDKIDYNSPIISRCTGNKFLFFDI